MPKENQDGQEKTEKPTGKRKSKARREGQVAKSQEMNTAAVLIAGLITLTLFGGWILSRLMGAMTGVYVHLDEIQVDPQNFRQYLAGAALWLLHTLSPIFVIVGVTGLLINLLQFGFIFTTKPLQPKPKFNLAKNFRQLFSQKSWVRLLVNMAKLAVIGTMVYTVLRRKFPSFLPLMDTDVSQIFLVLVHTILELAIYVFALIIIIAVIDFAYQKYQHMEDMKMTKEEVKDERKQSEGDPKMKAKMREMQMKFAFNTMIKELPKADVVVTNPVHVAVALKYDPVSMEAPKLIGKGKRKLAERIKQIARDNDIPIIENPPLARALFSSCEVGDEIPGQFYQDVAEILAAIYDLNAA